MAASSMSAQVRSLEIDKGVRDQHIKFLTEQNKTEHDLALRQNKYIGHLETKVYALGDKPDIKFLDAPKFNEPEIAHERTENHARRVILREPRYGAVISGMFSIQPIRIAVLSPNVETHGMPLACKHMTDQKPSTITTVS
ncbi:MAG TPA: hypothetical protein ENJ42_08635, partial [Hellea balneolensis]|nr:hypothetical protein [Hellea balneolensis]